MESTVSGVASATGAGVVTGTGPVVAVVTGAGAGVEIVACVVAGIGAGIVGVEVPAGICATVPAAGGAGAGVSAFCVQPDIIMAASIRHMTMGNIRLYMSLSF